METDNVTTAESRTPTGWLNIPMVQKLTRSIKDPKAFVLAVMMIEAYAKQGAPIKGDAFSLVALVHKFAKCRLELTEIEALRPDLLILFDEDQAGYLTPKPGLVALTDPYVTEDDD